MFCSCLIHQAEFVVPDKSGNYMFISVKTLAPARKFVDTTVKMLYTSSADFTYRINYISRK